MTFPVFSSLFTINVRFTSGGIISAVFLAHKYTTTVIYFQSLITHVTVRFSEYVRSFKNEHLGHSNSLKILLLFGIKFLVNVS